MTDFTKAELGYLQWLINQVHSSHMKNLIRPIKAKIKFKIDNYSETEEWEMIESDCERIG